MKQTDLRRVGGLGALAMALLAGISGPASPSPVLFRDQSAIRTASTFLIELENGRSNVAYTMLSPFSQRTNNIESVRPRVPLGQSGGFARHLRYAGDVRPEMVFGSGRFPPLNLNYQIVCFDDMPAQGFGAVHYISVFLSRAGAQGNWSVATYRIQSSPDPACGG